MNKTKIKNFAVSAHELLVEQIKIKAFEYEITDSIMPDIDTNSVHSRILDQSEKEQLKALIKAIKVHGYNHVIEEVAYTWFNRFIALRFMEVNNFLPQKIRVFTNEQDEFKPELLSEAIHLELQGLDKQKIFDFIDNNNEDGLYKYLLIALCNDMNQYLPELFTTFDYHDYTLLLLPDKLLKDDSILSKLVYEVDKEDWKDKDEYGKSTNAVTMIGWLYQYYISERHNQVTNILKGTVKKEDIPAATALFTTDWVVRYMVDNSLGRYWIERNPQSKLAEKLEFFVTPKNGEIQYINEKISPTDLTFFDTCMGSGHILVYAFDVLMEIYREVGYSDRDAALSIVENNLFGMDIDKRAYQLAYFAVMMKARGYNRRALTKGITNNLAVVEESNSIDKFTCDGLTLDSEQNKIGEYLIEVYKDAQEIGTLQTIEKKDYNGFIAYLNHINSSAGQIDLFSTAWLNDILPQMIQLAKQAEIMSNKYAVVCTNPPYMNKLEGQLKKFVVDNYKAYSGDLFSVFIYRNFDYCKVDGYSAFMTPFVWLYIKTYEKLRKYIIENKSILTLIQIEYSAFEEATVPICTFVLTNNKNQKIGQYFDLSKFVGGMNIQKEKVLYAIHHPKCTYFHDVNQNNYKRIDGNPIAFMASEKLLKIFETAKPLKEIAEPKVGLQTGNNDEFLRLWYEVNEEKIGFGIKTLDDAQKCGKKWFPYNKGGDFKRWYGNRNYVVNWENDGYAIKHCFNSEGKLRSRPQNKTYYLKPCITWSDITSAQFSGRYCEGGFLFDVKGSSGFPKNNELLYVLGFLNSKISQKCIKILNPTITTQVGDMARIPVYFDEEKKEKIELLVNNSINNVKMDWDAFEISWDFKKHPLICCEEDNLSVAFEMWSKECDEHFNMLKANEEELNRIFIDIYGLQDELTPEVEDKDVTVRKADLVRDIKSFISYAVGCMFGRYSLDVEELIYAGGEWDSSKYSTFIPDSDDIIPICDEDYFEDDILTRFIEFLRVVYGPDTLEENLQFITDALGGKGTPREVLRNYFLNDFFKDHCNTYQVTGSGKRPIYWLFDSGKKNGFKALVYIHRYTPDLIARMRTGYIHPQQARYRTQIEMLQGQIHDASNSNEKVKLSKQLKKINEQLLELNKYEEVIHHWADKMEPMDLDDGVKVNYAKFQELLAKIK